MKQYLYSQNSSEYGEEKGRSIFGTGSFFKIQMLFRKLLNIVLKVS